MSAQKEKSFFSRFLSSQFTSLPNPSEKYSSAFKNTTVIVTGANTGLGLEAARHIVRLGAARVILAVRNTAKGEAAQASIEKSTKIRGVAEVWQLDLSSYASVKRFAARADTELERVDALIENAGVVADQKFELVEGMETMATVNVLSTFLLALLLLPKLRKTAVGFGVVPRVVVVSSEGHELAEFKEAKEERIFDALRDEKKSNLDDRYNVTKLIQIYLVRGLATHLTQSSKEGQIILNSINPGLCRTELNRDAPAVARAIEGVIKLVLARSAEAGSRTLVHAAQADASSHGTYLRDCKVTPPAKFVLSEDGQKTQERLYTELLEELEKIQPGVSENI